MRTRKETHREQVSVCESEKEWPRKNAVTFTQTHVGFAGWLAAKLDIVY